MSKKKPLVAIIGRPNVGKSTFFNRISGKRVSIVKDIPGVTRDRIYVDAEWCGYVFTMIDTGGIEFDDNDTMYGHIRKQAKEAMELADVIVFMVDGKAGLVSTDYDVAELLRTAKKPVVLVVNKLDNFEVEKTYDFYQLGLGEPFAVSCEQAKGLGEVLDEIISHFPEPTDFDEDSALKIAVVGKPNVGKSSIVNKLLGFERVIVSDVAGTTRDAVDTPFEYNGNKYILIDTAGMRRKRGIDEDTVESYSVMRTIAAVRRADVVLIVIDSTQELSEQDVRIAGFVHDEGKPSVIVMNKWDKVEKDTYTVNKLNEKLAQDLAFMSYKKSVYVSAATGQRLDKLVSMVSEAYRNASARISTGLLNDIVGEAVAMTEPPSFSGKKLKIYYTTQPESNPPKFVFFVNDEKLAHFSYRRYLENCLRKAFDFSCTPIRLNFVSKEKNK
ncbi:MAG: ribosome biogenesis GTPase Der [Clostridia bacterium]|nr:ribosome biogenesis GTPase Der [Clostridia bacterium]